MDYASYHNEIDDGTDDNEVVDIQVNQHMNFWAAMWSFWGDQITA